MLKFLKAPVYIVSGFPRSGTSLTMQILKNGGMDLAYDGLRTADEHNQKGYYEIDDIINKIKNQPDFILNYKKQVVKVTNYGIQYLPTWKYKVLYINRNIKEIMRSMEKMSGKPDPEPEKTFELLTGYESKVKDFLAGRNDIETEEIYFNRLVSDPDDEIDKISRFLKISAKRKPLMREAIDKKDYRNRAERT